MKSSNEAKIQLRLPADLRDWFAKLAAQNDRSMNAQMIAMIRGQMKATSEPAQ
jgi:hypothetical protein